MFTRPIGPANRLVLPLLLFLLGPHPLGAQNTEAERLLNLHTKAHKYCEKIKMQVHMEGANFEDTTDSTETGTSSSDFTYLRDGDQVALDGTGSWTNFQTEQSRIYHFRYVLNKRVAVRSSYITDKEKTTTKPTSGAVSLDAKKHLEDFLGEENTGGALDGYCEGTNGVRLGELMRGAADLRLLPNEEISGSSCRVLEAKTPYGHIKLWLAPAHNYLLQKALLEKRPGDIYRYGKTSEVWNVTVSIENTQFGVVAGVPLPLEGNLTRKRSTTGRKTEGVTCRFRRSNITLNPAVKAEEDFRETLPEGLRVSNWDDLGGGIKYRWSGGTLVPVYAGFDGGANKPASNRNLLKMALLVIVGVFLLFAGLRYYLKRGRAT